MLRWENAKVNIIQITSGIHNCSGSIGIKIYRVTNIFRNVIYRGSTVFRNVTFFKIKEIYLGKFTQGCKFFKNRQDQELI